MMRLCDTIAAVSTPYGKGGVALLRLSGERAVEIADRVFLPKSGRPLSSYPPRTAVLGSILALGEGEPEVIDEGLATVFYAPASFTGETTVEISCHGGILLTETVLTSLLAAGARAAEAGEFTRRAFLNGKLGLSSAEALGDVLEARTREQLSLAHNGLSGGLARRCREIYERLTQLLASVYARIDYPDEDLADLTPSEILDGLESCYAELSALAATYRTGHAVAEGIPTAICGRPNVGKSSLYNRLVGREAAIVTEIEGTTRDLLAETAAVGRVTLRLMDTAGLRSTDNPVERIGIERAREALSSAELILAVFDGGRVPDKEEYALADELAAVSGEVVALVNKSDLGDAGMLSFCREHFSTVLSISVRSGQGMEKLVAAIESLFIDGSIRLSTDAVLTNARQHAAALGAVESVGRAVETLRAGLPLELSCSDAEGALTALGEIDGRAVSEDIVSEIFSHFCVGK